MSPRWRRRTYFLFELFSAVIGLAIIPLILLALFTDVAGAVPLLIAWVVVELALMLLRPYALGRDDGYRPPKGRVP